jgi:adenylate kinase family enzyme
MTTRIVILGNSGSGKSTLARRLAAPGQTPVLDLDTIVWEPGQIAVARPLPAVHADLDRFCAEHAAWIIEGCYGALAERLLAGEPAPELLFVNPGEAACLSTEEWSR